MEQFMSFFHSIFLFVICSVFVENASLWLILNKLTITDMGWCRHSVAAKGEAGAGEREARIRDYAKKVTSDYSAPPPSSADGKCRPRTQARKGEVQFIPTKVVCNLDPELIAAFAREFLRAVSDTWGGGGLSLVIATLRLC